jgi:hypothetical protein
LLFPDRRSGRWWIPTDPITWEAAATLVHGHLNRLKLRVLFATTGKFLQPSAVARSSGPTPLDRWLASAFDRPCRHIAIYRGTPSMFAKDTVQCLDADGQVLGYAKIARAEGSLRSIEREAECLRDLAEKLPAETFFPRVFKSERGISLQSPPPAGYRPDPSKTGEILKLLKFNFATEIPWSASPAHAKLAAAVDALRCAGFNEWADTLDAEMQFLADHLGPSPAPHWLAHGDFVPWNTIGRFAFDWEWAGADLPWQDALHYAWFPLLSGRRQPSRSRLASAWHSTLRNFNLHSGGDPDPLNPQWARAYLAERLAFYSHSALENHDDPRQFRFLRHMHGLLCDHH